MTPGALVLSPERSEDGRKGGRVSGFSSARPSLRGRERNTELDSGRTDTAEALRMRFLSQGQLREGGGRDLAGWEGITAYS